MPLSRRETITQAMAMLAGYDWRNVLDVREEPDGFMRCEIADSRSMSGRMLARYQKRIVFEVGGILQAEHGPSETHRVPVSVIPRTHSERYLRGQEETSVWKLGSGNVLMIYNNSSSLVLFRFRDWSVLHLFRLADHGEFDFPSGGPHPSNAQDSYTRILRERIDQVRTLPQYPPENSTLHGFRISAQTEEIMRAPWPAKRVRARMEHQCAHCGGVISSGETYVCKKRMVGARAWATIKMHDQCYEHVLRRLMRRCVVFDTVVSDDTFDMARTLQRLTTQGSVATQVTPDGAIDHITPEIRNTGVVLESFTEAYAIVWQAVGHKTCGYHKIYKSNEKAKRELEAVKQRDPTRLYTLQTVQVVE